MLKSQILKKKIQKLKKSLKFKKSKKKLFFLNPKRRKKKLSKITFFLQKIRNVLKKNFSKTNQHCFLILGIHDLTTAL